ncbi:MAG TPA: polymer-forming cytoskeletal protein [Bacillota bacterium]|nr:polymer-forming cytoskeletal protein [Bacillota bacterium]
MLSKKRENTGFKVDTVLGKDFSYKGIMEASGGSLRIDGYFEGELCIGGDLVIGETGTVYGSIIAKNITIAGEVRGNIEARGKLELTPSAKVLADAKMVFFVIEDGAFFQGQCEPLSREDIKERGKTLVVDSEENSN